MNFPDLSLLEPLGEQLGLTVSELLSGARGEQPGEQLLRDSLRLAPAQLGRKLKRWQVLALSCLGVLLALALGAGYWYVKYHTELLPQRETVLAPIQRSELDQLAFQTAGLPSVYCYDLTWADSATHCQVQMEYWTEDGLVRTWPVAEAGGFPDTPRHQQLAFSYSTDLEHASMKLGVTLSPGTWQPTLNQIPGLENGYVMAALNETCQVCPEDGAVLACFSLAREDSATEQEGPAYRVPGWTGAVKAPDVGDGESFLLLRLTVA